MTRINRTLNKKVAEQLYHLLGDNEKGDSLVLEYLYLDFNEEQAEYFGGILSTFIRYAEFVNFRIRHDFE